MTKLGEKLNYSCRLSFDTPHWYDVNGEKIKRSTAQTVRQISIIGNITILAFSDVNLNNAGVYFCNGEKRYGALIIYLQGLLLSKFVKSTATKYLVPTNDTVARYQCH